MPEQNSLPLSLKAVAAFFIVVGIVSAVKMVVDDRITSSPGSVLFLLIGYGLLQRKSFWRRVALAVAWAAIILKPVLVVDAYRSPVEHTISVLGQSLNLHSPAGITAAAGSVLVVMGISCWVIWTLQREPVKHQFAS